MGTIAVGCVGKCFCKCQNGKRLEMGLLFEGERERERESE